MDSLGDRMKGYEVATRTSLTNRMPVIVRVDGKAFHTYTRGCKRPFDERLSGVMVATARELCNQVQGCQLAYTQSDEISLLLHGFKKFDSQPWFDNQVQKIASVAAGIASATFTAQSWRIWRDHETPIESDDTLTALTKRIRPAIFDARVFIVPEADVCNYFLWRQQDAMRNSVQMLARSMFSHKQCDSKNVMELRQMCLQEGSPYENLAVRYQRGMCLKREEKVEHCTGGGCFEGCQHSPSGDREGRWMLDDNIPIFSENRDYVNDLLKLEEG